MIKFGEFEIELLGLIIIAATIMFVVTKCS
jgi:hypothetical protein